MSDLLSLCIDELAHVHGGAPRVSGRSGEDQTTKLRLDLMNQYLGQCKAELAQAAELPAAQRRDAHHRARMNCDIAAGFR